MASKLSAALAACVFATAMVASAPTQAVRMDDGGGYYHVSVECNESTVTFLGGSVKTRMCWLEKEWVATSQISYELDEGSILEWYNGGPPRSVFPVEIPGWSNFEGKVSPDGKKVWAILDCNTPFESLAGVVHAGTLAVKGSVNSGFQTTLYMPNGYEQTFVKVPNNAALAVPWAPVSTCHKG